MPTITLKIDDQDVTVTDGATILEAAKTIGKTIPHYCYHPGLSIAGNCRMCLVQVEKMPKPVIGCKTLVTEGMVVRTQTPEVKKIQTSIMEFLLINHPLDCPTCDQAGECRLQDYYMDFDRIPSRFKEEKVHKKKMVDLGAGVMLDEERCIVCTRCVRFCDEIAGVNELYVQARGDHAMVATFPGASLKNPYAGCTVDVCPVGALTSKDFRYKKRVWFLSQTASVCCGCSRGCNIDIHHADRRVYRLKPRFNADVNSYWMCDEGRNGYTFINDGRRLKPAVRDGAVLKDESYAEALMRAQILLYRRLPGEIAFVASARESNESIDAFVAFAREVYLATDVFYSKNDPAEPFSDNFLITADKNPNVAHAQKLGIKPLTDLTVGIKTLVVQRDLSTADIRLTRERGIGISLLFATNLTACDALTEVVLPIPVYAEHSGHFTNLNRQAQRFDQAFAPHGEARPIAEYLADLSRKGAVRRAG